jgi:hypothetical protein
MADLSKIMIPNGTTYTIKDETARELADSKSEVSVSQTLTSGTEIGSVTVDGTVTKLYAPQGGGSVDALTDAEIEAAVDGAFVYNITLNFGSTIASVQNLQEQTVTTGIVGETYMVVCDNIISSISSTPQVTFQLDSTKAYFVMPDEAISIDVYVAHQGGDN